MASWIEQRELPVHVVRYEDLLVDTGAAFEAVLRFAGLEPEPERLARAVEHARFDGLRAQEERSGFREMPPTARFFFRAGRPGGVAGNALAGAGADARRCARPPHGTVRLPPRGGGVPGEPGRER